MTGSVVSERLLELLGAAPAFDELSEEVRRRLLGEVIVRYYGPEAVILEQGATSHEFLYIVESGFVRLSERPSGRLVDDYGEKDVFGNYGLMKGGELPYEARAVEPTVCALVPAEVFWELYRESEAFAAFFDKNLRAFTEASREREVPAFDAAGSRVLFGTRLGELVGREAVVCTPRATIREVARTMREERADAVVVVRDGEIAGLFSDMDLRDKVVAEGAPFETPVWELMDRDVVRLGAQETVFRALMEMMQHGSYHVVVTEGPDGAGNGSKLLGVVSDQDISRAQGASPAFLAQRIERTGEVSDLAGLRPEVAKLLLHLERQGVKPRDLISINTELNERLMRRIVRLVEEELSREKPEARVDLRWAWLSLGSEGRGEMSLLTDQDNALVYADPSGEEEAKAAERWFSELSEKANRSLADCGFALCEGGIMARNPSWRNTLGGWKARFKEWVTKPDRDVLVRAATLYDLSVLHGDARLVSDLKSSLPRTLNSRRGFLPYMAQVALANRPPLSFFRRFVLERSGEYRHTFNVKRRGLRPLVDSARVVCIDEGYAESAHTEDRYRYIAREVEDLSPTAADALDAYLYLAELRFMHHLRAVERGEKPNNQINPSDLTSTQQNILKVVFSTVGETQNAVANRYGLNTRL